MRSAGEVAGTAPPAAAICSHGGGHDSSWPRGPVPKCSRPEGTTAKGWLRASSLYIGSCHGISIAVSKMRTNVVDDVCDLLIAEFSPDESRHRLLSVHNDRDRISRNGEFAVICQSRICARPNTALRIGHVATLTDAFEDRLATLLQK